jgi:hypothetical protein
MPDFQVNNLTYRKINFNFMLHHIFVLKFLFSNVILDIYLKIFHFEESSKLEENCRTYLYKEFLFHFHPDSLITNILPYFSHPPPPHIHAHVPKYTHTSDFFLNNLRANFRCDTPYPSTFTRGHTPLKQELQISKS